MSKKTTDQRDPKQARRPKPEGARRGKAPAPLWSQAITTLIVFFLLASTYIYFSDQQSQEADRAATVSEVAGAIRNGQVESIVVEDDTLTVTYKGAENQPVVTKEATKETGVGVAETLTAYGVTPDQLSGVRIEVKQPSGALVLLLGILPYALTIILVLFLVWMVTRQMKGAGMQAMTFGQSRARITDPNDTKQKVTFKDVAGAKEAKQELSEIVDFLKNPKKFLAIGARIPKGVLMMGAPGTGKTLLARAVAGEANVPFFSISGSEFVEMFVGVGASRVRDLFRMAKQAAPAIIFIDEIDAVGRARGVGVGGGNDEREQTLNQILVEMDGFEPNEKVIVMAATNRPDVLDSAILRPGRFDRRVMIDLPDRDDREAILKVQAVGKPLGEDVNLRTVAERTPGFSGADLYSLVNEAAILAAREDRTQIAQYDLVRSIEKVILGPERQSHLMNKKEKELTAYHEAGHALVAAVLPNSDPVHKISVISRGRAMGYTLKLPLEDKRMQSKSEFLDDIAMSLGGYVTEKIVFGDVTTGPSNDLQVSTALARAMVTRYGMSDSLGAMAFESSGRTLPGSGEGLEGGEFSRKVGDEIDSEVSRIMKEAYQRAESIIIEKRPLLDVIAKRLVEKETIERDEFESILVAHGITPKKVDVASDAIVIAG
jgi:cell division protease FtsH